LADNFSVSSRLHLIVLAAAALASCRTAGPALSGPSGSSGSGAATPADAPVQIVQPGAPGQASTVISAEKASDLSQVEYTGADIKFMQGMIGHHAQAIEMVALVKAKSTSEDVKKLALRIDLSQEDEIKMMQSWLQQRGQPVPARNAMHMHGATLMPGMLTPDEMKQLADANGAEFDRLFLEGMIKHHGGALTMVADLLGSPGAAQESEVFAFVSDVEADQRMEIGRMEAMLAMVKEHK
jgi:uncharacterized protein (DUF305 family)